MAAHPLLRLQRRAGNAAVSRLVTDALVQRDPVPGLPAGSPPPLQLPPGTALPPGVQMVPLESIEYTQEDISNTYQDPESGRPTSVGRMAAQMRRTGWDRSRPATVVRMPDGRLVSLDHRRLWAAERAGLREVSVRVQEAATPLPRDQAERFEIRRGRVPTGTNPRTGQPWRRGDRPATWGDTVGFRSAGQQFSATNRLTTSGPARGQVPGAVRDPSFPATGSPRLPIRLPPRPMRPTPPRLYPTEVARPGTPTPGPRVPSPIPPIPARPGLAPTEVATPPLPVPRPVPPARPALNPTEVAPPPGPAPAVPRPITPAAASGSRLLGLGGRLLSVFGVISTIRQAIDFAQHVDDPESVLTLTGFVDLRTLPLGTRVEDWSFRPPRRGVLSQDDHGHRFVLWDDLST